MAGEDNGGGARRGWEPGAGPRAHVLEGGVPRYGARRLRGLPRQVRLPRVREGDYLVARPCFCASRAKLSVIAGI